MMRIKLVTFAIIICFHGSIVKKFKLQLVCPKAAQLFGHRSFVYIVRTVTISIAIKHQQSLLQVHSNTGQQAMALELEFLPTVASY